VALTWSWASISAPVRCNSERPVKEYFLPSGHAHKLMAEVLQDDAFTDGSIQNGEHQEAALRALVVEAWCKTAPRTAFPIGR
jgi:hypothetical protein